MTYEEMSDAYFPNDDHSGWNSRSAKRLVNATLRHAVDSGQVVAVERSDY